MILFSYYLINKYRLGQRDGFASFLLCQTVGIRDPGFEYLCLAFADCIKPKAVPNND